MESLNEIRYKYEHGVYSIEHLIKLVDQNIISKQEFKDICRLYYDAIDIEKIEKIDKEKEGTDE